MITSRDTASPKSICLVDATISQLLNALSRGHLTSVDLVARYMHRIAAYDCNGPALNSICVLNPRAFEEAQFSDRYRASGKKPRPLEGIPFTVKDSFKVEGLTVAAGSPAFADLVSSSDAAIVARLRQAGAVVLGKTNMPAMADGGCQRGLYGRAESPYNPVFSTTAYASGSSSGCGTATAASLAAFGFAGETVSSGRAPASNNALFGYSPSRGVIPARGQWPLYPTCDVIVPHTRTMDDMFHVLNAIVFDVDTPQGDFWRMQSAVPIPRSSEVRPADYHSLADPSALCGKRIALPKCYTGQSSIGRTTAATTTTIFTKAVSELWERAVADLERLGAVVEEVDSFPLLDEYTKQLHPGQSANIPGLPPSWNDVERCDMIALAWDDFLRSNNVPQYPMLAAADLTLIHPHIAPLDDPTRFTETQNHIRYAEIFEVAKNRKGGGLLDLPGLDRALNALEDMRQRFLERWMDDNGYDLIAFPTNGDVARADADEILDSMLHALQDGCKYSNGGRALKHLGVPAITVPMGNLSDIGMPVGLTFCGKAYSDNELLACSYAFERGTNRRIAPPLTPALDTDFIPLTDAQDGRVVLSSDLEPVLKVQSTETSIQPSDPTSRTIRVKGNATLAGSGCPMDHVDVFVGGQHTSTVNFCPDGQWEWSQTVRRSPLEQKYPPLAKLPRDSIFLTFIARSSSAGGRTAGAYALVD